MKPASKQCYELAMREEQQIIVDWMKRQRERLGISWEEWAKRAGIKSATTLTRAIKADYESVTSIPTLHALAKAANVPSVLDHLRQDKQQSGPIDPNVISIVLSELLRRRGSGRLDDSSLRALGEALAHVLQLLAEHPDIAENSSSLRVAAQSAASLFPAPNSEA